MITRRKKNNNFTVLDNKTIKDPALSWKATGLLCYLLSLPDNWKVISEHLASVKTDGITVVRSSLSELEEAGYIRRYRVQIKGIPVYVCDIAEYPYDFPEKADEEALVSSDFPISEVSYFMEDITL